MKRAASYVLMLAGVLGTGPGCRMLFRREPAPPPVPPERALRLPPRGAPLTGFEQIAGWDAESKTGRVRFDKDLEKAIWGEYAGWLRFTPRSEGPHEVFIRPKESWLVNAPFNLMTVWVWHELEEEGPVEGYEVFLEGTGPMGRGYTWTFPYRPSAGWQMLHLRVKGDSIWPLTLTKLGWRLPEGVEETQALFLENLSVYQESVARIPREIQYVRPHDYAPAFAPKRRNSVLLDFPPRPAAFRPVAPQEKVVVRLDREAENRYLFRSESASVTVEYLLEMREQFPMISVRVNGRELGRVWQGVEVATQGELPAFRLSRMEGGKLILQYAEGLRFTVSLQGRTLELEAHSLNETFTGVRLGRLTGGEGGEAERLEVPFLRVSREASWPLATVRQGEGVYFVSVIPDWWFSMAGEVIEPSAESGLMDLGSLLYPPRWKGSRNVFRERVYFTVSTQFEDVLPGPAAPVALMRGEAGAVLWPGEKGLRLRLMQMQPVDPEWREDDLARDWEGNWRGFAPQRFFMKSARFSDLAISRLPPTGLDPETGYTHTPWLSRFPPWRFTDYDARVLGAGTFAQTWAELGVLLQQVAAETGVPLFGDGGAEWFYAGFLSGVVPEFSGGMEALHPFLPQMVHRNIAPYSAVMGVGSAEAFQGGEGEVEDTPERFWRQVATQIAYTACGRVPETADAGLRAQGERLLRRLHARFVASPVVRLLYWNGTRLQGVSESFADGSLGRSQIYFRLENGDEIWVNGSETEDWTVRVEGRQYRLPPFGFRIRGEGLDLYRVRNESGAEKIFDGGD